MCSCAFFLIFVFVFGLVRSGRVSFYTSVGCDVFLFNYRGYARSGGRASPAAINKDVQEVTAAVENACEN